CLAPLVDDPAEARPLPEAAAALEELSTAPDLDLALISGRPAADLIHLATPPANTWIIGSHGAEIGRVDGEGEMQQQAFVLCPAEVELLEAVPAQLSELAGDRADLWVDLKPAAAVLHSRQAQPEVGAAARAAALTGPGALDGVHPIDGNEVVEIAVVAATKGKALTKLRADVEGRRGAPVTVRCAGDDR